jgi:large repetitive protein
VVVFRSPGLPLRNLTVFGGLADVGQGDPQSITANLTTAR